MRNVSLAERDYKYLMDHLNGMLDTSTWLGSELEKVGGNQKTHLGILRFKLWNVPRT